MQITVTIEDDLYNKALELADPSIDKADLLQEALKTFVQVRVAKRLIALGGKAPQAPIPPRRRQDPAE